MKKDKKMEQREIRKNGKNKRMENKEKRNKIEEKEKTTCHVTKVHQVTKNQLSGL